jgi:hypothetical protein
MSIGTKNIDICKQLILWFEKDLRPKSQVLTLDFIKDYKPKYDNRIKRRKKDKEEIDALIDREQRKLQTNIKLKTQFISKLKRFRKSKSYLQKKRNRQNIVHELKECLDYPKFKNINLKKFFSIKDLGTIVAIKVKAKILENPTKFLNLMKFVCNERIPLKTRIDEALKGKFSIEEIGEGFISKI